MIGKAEISDLLVHQIVHVSSFTYQRNAIIQPDTRKLFEFSKKIVNACDLELVNIKVAIVYIQRFNKILPESAICSQDTPLRLIIAALIISKKYLTDYRAHNVKWIGFLDMFSLNDLNLIERQFLALLDWNVNVTVNELNSILQ